MITIPTLTDLNADIVALFESHLGITMSASDRKFMRGYAGVLAGKLKSVYLSLGKVQRNIFVDSADQDELTRWGLVKLGRAPFPATQGLYTVTVSFTAPGTISANTTFKSNDDAEAPGLIYVLDTDGTFVGPGTGTLSVTLRALTAGVEALLAVGDKLTCTVPLANAGEEVTVTAVATAPQAAEDLEDYRQKVIDSFRLEPQGGAAADYRLWAADAQGVKQSYPYAKSGAANEIDLYVEATIADSTDGQGTPGTTILDAVADVIELDPDTTLDISERGRRPLAVYAVNVLPVDVKPVTITITGLVDSTTAKQATITAALVEAVNAIRPFIPGADVLDLRNDMVSKNLLIQAILNALPGAQFTSITLNVDASPVTSYTFDNGEIPFLNATTGVSYV